VAGAIGFARRRADGRERKCGQRKIGGQIRHSRTRAQPEGQFGGRGVGGGGVTRCTACTQQRGFGGPIGLDGPGRMPGGWGNGGTWWTAGMPAGPALGSAGNRPRGVFGRPGSCWFLDGSRHGSLRQSGNSWRATISRKIESAATGGPRHHPDRACGKRVKGTSSGWDPGAYPPGASPIIMKCRRGTVRDGLRALHLGAYWHGDTSIGMGVGMTFTPLVTGFAA